jgi:hypothetical protein
MTVHGRRWPDIWGDLVIASVEHDLGLELPTRPDVLLEQVDEIQGLGRPELLVACDDRLNAVNAVGADRAGAMIRPSASAALNSSGGSRMPRPSR